MQLSGWSFQKKLKWDRIVTLVWIWRLTLSGIWFFWSNPVLCGLVISVFTSSHCTGLLTENSAPFLTRNLVSSALSSRIFLLQTFECLSVPSGPSKLLSWRAFLPKLHPAPLFTSWHFSVLFSGRHSVFEVTLCAGAFMCVLSLSQTKGWGTLSVLLSALSRGW